MLVTAAEPPQPSIVERVGNGALFGLAAFFGGTFLISVGTYFHKYNQPEAKARRKVCFFLFLLDRVCSHEGIVLATTCHIGSMLFRAHAGFVNKLQGMT